jgi:hypothetical protein
VANNFIGTTAGNPPAALKRMRDVGEEFVQRLRSIAGVMNAMDDDYTAIETHFGLPTGKGQAAKAEVNSVLGVLDTASADTITRQTVKDALAQLFNYFGP